jgi:gamma-glutamyltranspeptidase / glutathione hydrolase
MKMRAFDRPGRSTAYGARGMAATSAPLATLAAIDCCGPGGNAADAAVVASAVLCVVEPAMTGIGGDCFALVGTPEGKVRASMPAAARRDGGGCRLAEGLRPQRSRPLDPCITVPGAIDGWDRLLKAWHDGAWARR